MVHTTKSRMRILVPAFAALIILGALLPVLSPMLSVYNIKADSGPVTVRGRQLYVDGQPFQVRGVGYSPTPLGVGMGQAPPNGGDLYSVENSAIYDRDLPLLKAMGANTIRLWAWNNDANHTDFLNKAYADGMHVIVSFWINGGQDITSPQVREQLKIEFRQMVAANKDSPAVLMWLVGNELNGAWMYGDKKDTLYSLINEMAAEAHNVEGASAHPVSTTLAEPDMLQVVAKYDRAMTNLDVWSLQPYRGETFGTLFQDYEKLSSKPLLLTEYGIDAYDNVHRAEYEKISTPSQSVYDASLWKEINANSQICIGGSVMAYSDEWWKGQASNPVETDPNYQGEAGYVNSYHPDGYSNEEWWGIMRVAKNGTSLDIMEPRAAYYALQTMWKDPPFKQQSASAENASLSAFALLATPEFLAFIICSVLVAAAIAMRVLALEKRKSRSPI
jgi:hypothetical protein